MKIELKNIHHSPSLSEESEAFAANLYINSVHAGTVSNRGHGGSTEYQAINEKGRELIREAEAYCKTLPPTTYPERDGMEAFSIDMDLEQKIDKLLGGHLDQKELARFTSKLNKAMQTGIMYGVPDKSFAGIVYKVPLEQLLKSPQGTERLVKTLKNDVLPELKGGIIILNTNIPEGIFRKAGINETQHISTKAYQAQENPKPKRRPKL